MRYLISFLLLALLLRCGSTQPQPAQPAKAVERKKSDTTKANRQMLLIARYTIQSGDLVFRTGNDLVSDYFKQLNLNDKTYSHCGIADVKGGRVYIYHVLGGEYNPNQRILREPLESFVTPLENDGFGIYRYPFSANEQKQVMVTADSLFRGPAQFDYSFDLATNDKLYCAEFVYKAIVWGTRGRIKPNTTPTPYREGVTTDNLFLAPGSRQIARFAFE